MSARRPDGTLGPRNDERRSMTVRGGDLPEAVRRYVRRALPNRGPLPGIVRITQTGEMQLKPGRWLPFEATQEAQVGRVEFAWRPRFALAPLIGVRRSALDGFLRRLPGARRRPGADAGGGQLGASERAVRVLPGAGHDPRARVTTAAARFFHHGSSDRRGSAAAGVTMNTRGSPS